MVEGSFYWQGAPKLWVYTPRPPALLKSCCYILTRSQSPTPGPVLKLEQKMHFTVANWIYTIVHPRISLWMLFPVATWAQSCYEGCPPNFQVPDTDLELKSQDHHYFPSIFHQERSRFSVFP